MSATQYLGQEVGEGEMKHLQYRMLFLFHLLFGAIFEGPFDNVGLMRGTLDMVALVKLCPKVVEVLEFYQMPDLGERGGYNGGLCDGG